MVTYKQIFDKMEQASLILNYFSKMMDWDVYKYLIPEKRLHEEEVVKKLDECSRVLH